jgi:signal transduction histidine kinase
MSGDFLLDWAALAVSLLNAILLLWLGLTVLLNAERRTWGTWLATTALLAGFIFFISHTILLSYGFELPTGALNFWWQTGWIPLIGIPLAWYAIILWYSSHWEKVDTTNSNLRRTAFWLVLVIALFIAGALLVANPLPDTSEVSQLEIVSNPSLHGLPLLVLFYPLYALLCTGLSIEALLHPAPAQRVMGEFARQRARPWLVAASITLLLISLLVAWVVGWLLLFVSSDLYQPQIIHSLAWFDLVIAALITLTTLCVGQAIVSYEVFTGKILPRRGLLNSWYRMVILAAGFSLVMSWGALAPLRPIYNLLLSVLLITVFLALLSWRSYNEREQSIDNLRPFVTSQRLFDHLISQSDKLAPPIETQIPFQMLCMQVLEARKALLVPLGPFAALTGPSLTYPAGDAFPEPKLDDLLAEMGSSRPLCLPVPPQAMPGLSWAIPLWSERGLTGIFFLGEKRLGSLYTQEEIEIARTIGERLIDIQASAEMARRLMVLQRQHLAESQVIDRRTRRSLHDDILPELHTAILSLSDPAEENERIAEVLASLSRLHTQVAKLLAELPAVIEPEISRLGLIGALQLTIEREFKDEFDRIEWRIIDPAEQMSRNLPPMHSEILYYAAREAIRNAARHGRGHNPNRPLQLSLQVSWDKGLQMVFEDNGIGIQKTEPTKKTPDQLNSGRGLALHSTLMAAVGGSLALESSPGAYTRVSLFLPEVQT